jgi:Rrf2 family protein
VHVSKAADYALRAVLELARTGGTTLTAKQLSQAQQIPQPFLQHLLLDLKRADIVLTQRGAGGGYRLARSSAAITLADIVRAVDGPLVQVHGLRPEVVAYDDSARVLREVWIAVRVSLRGVLEHVTVADLAAGALPPTLQGLLEQPDAWVRH